MYQDNPQEYVQIVFDEVTYRGEVGRLSFTVERADSLLLPVYFKSFARELKAGFHEQKAGECPVLQPPKPGPGEDLNEPLLQKYTLERPFPSQAVGNVAGQEIC